MNMFVLGKIEACIELSNGNAEKFKKMVKKVTGITGDDFNDLCVTSVAYGMLKRGESVSDTINAVI